MRRFGVLAFLAAATCLASCGNAPTGREFRSALAAAGEVVTPDKTPPPEVLGRASYQAVPGPLIFVVLRDGTAAAPMVPFGDNRGFRTWSTAEKQMLTLRGGIMSSTRGLGDDLMQASVDPVTRAVAAGSGDGVARTTWHLDGDNTLIARRFDCTLRSEGREAITLVSGEGLTATRVSEACSAKDASFRNTYWKDESGTVRRSRQWVSPDVGYATIEVLRE